MRFPKQSAHILAATIAISLWMGCGSLRTSAERARYRCSIRTGDSILFNERIVSSSTDTYGNNPSMMLARRQVGQASLRAVGSTDTSVLWSLHKAYIVSVWKSGYGAAKVSEHPFYSDQEPQQTTFPSFSTDRSGIASDSMGGVMLGGVDRIYVSPGFKMFPSEWFVPALLRQWQLGDTISVRMLDTIRSVSARDTVESFGDLLLQYTYSLTKIREVDTMGVHALVIAWRMDSIDIRTQFNGWFKEYVGVSYNSELHQWGTTTGLSYYSTLDGILMYSKALSACRSEFRALGGEAPDLYSTETIESILERLPNNNIDP